MAIPKQRVRYVRPDKIEGSTYKVKAPEHEAFYVAINNGIVDDEMRPVEVLINSKDVDSFQWQSLVARMLSALFQRPGPFPEFIIEELKDSHDPLGGYFIPGKGIKCSGVVSHIGYVVEEHCNQMGLLSKPKKKKP